MAWELFFSFCRWWFEIVIPEVKLFLSLKGGRLRWEGGMRVEGWWVFLFFKIGIA